MNEENFGIILKALRGNVYSREVPTDIDAILRQTMTRIKNANEPAGSVLVTESMLFWAFRYCINRQSYAVGDCVDSLRMNWTGLTKSTKDKICQEIRWKLDSPAGGMMQCDIDAWKSVLALEGS